MIGPKTRGMLATAAMEVAVPASHFNFGKRYGNRLSILLRMDLVAWQKCPETIRVTPKGMRYV